MSAEAMGHVFRYSPYRGGTAVAAVLVAVADTVNDSNGYRFYAGQEDTAKKARISKRRAGPALQQLVDDGWLEELVPATNRDPAEYRFIIDYNRPIVWLPRALREEQEAAEAAAVGVDAPSTPTAPGPVDKSKSGVDAPSTQTRAGVDATSPQGGRSVAPGVDAASTEPKSNPSEPNACRPHAVPAVENPDPLDGDWPPLLEAIATRLDDHHANRLAGETHERLHALQVVLHHLLADGWTPKRIAERLTRAPLVGEITSVAAILASRAVEARQGDRRRQTAGPGRDAIPASDLRDLEARADELAIDDAGTVDVALRQGVLEELEAAWLAQHGAPV